jgi:ubiquitin-like domain-containing CTD phosphatase 1
MAHAHDFTTVTLVAKYNKERIVLDGLPPSTTILQVKELIQQQTRILPKRQKLVGLTAAIGGAKGVHDQLALCELHVKGKTPVPVDRIVTIQCILMGTPEEQIFVDPGDRDDLPDVVDDFELDFNAGSAEWMQHVANEANLRDFTEKTAVQIMTPPREGKPLLVLDLDHTLMDFSSQRLQRSSSVASSSLEGGEHDEASAMKRPYMNQFLSTCYRNYDLVVWSQTSWRCVVEGKWKIVGWRSVAQSHCCCALILNQILSAFLRQVAGDQADRTGYDISSGLQILLCFGQD